jgi:hypothetical protein
VKNILLRWEREKERQRVLLRQGGGLERRDLGSAGEKQRGTQWVKIQYMWKISH